MTARERTQVREAITRLAADEWDAAMRILHGLAGLEWPGNQIGELPRIEVHNLRKVSVQCAEPTKEDPDA